MYLFLLEQENKVGPCVRLGRGTKFIFRRYLGEVERQRIEKETGKQFENGGGWYKWIRHSNISRQAHFEIEFDEDQDDWIVHPTFTGNQLPVQLNDLDLRKGERRSIIAGDTISVGLVGKVQIRLGLHESIPRREQFRHKLPLEKLSSQTSTNTAFATDKLVKEKPEHMMSQFVLDHTRRALKLFLYNLYQSTYRANAAREGEVQLLKSLSELTGDSNVLIIEYDDLRKLAESEGIDQSELYRLANESSKNPKSAILYDCDDERMKQIILCPFRNRTAFVCVIGDSLLFEDLITIRDIAFVLDYSVINAQAPSKYIDDTEKLRVQIDAEVETRKKEIFGEQLEIASVQEIANQLADVAKRNLFRKRLNAARAPAEQNRLISIYLRGEQGVGKTYFATCYAKLMGCECNRLNCAFDLGGTSDAANFGSQLFGAILHNLGREEVKKGMIEVCAGQVLFLDEIAELSNPNLLLGYLDTGTKLRQYTRISGTQQLREDNVALVFATNRDLPREYDTLIRRLEEATQVIVPPLRDRRPLIEPLALHFIKEQAEIEEIPPRALTEEDRLFICQYDWPKNVSELESACRKFATSNGKSLQAIVYSTHMVSGERALESEIKTAAGIQFPGILLQHPKHFQTALLIVLIDSVASKGFDREEVAINVGFGDNGALRKKVLLDVNDDFLMLDQVAKWVQSHSHFMSHVQRWGNLVLQIGKRV